MPSGLRLMVVKEVKDLLRDPKILVGMIIFPALLLPLMGAAINVATSSTIEKASGNLTVYVVDDDKGPFSEALLSYFIANNVEVKTLLGPPQESAKGLGGGDVLIYIPQGASGNLTSGSRTGMLMFVNFKSFSLVEFIVSGRIDSILSVFEGELVKRTISEGMPGRDAGEVLDPITVEYESIVKGEAFPLSPAVLQSTVKMQTMMGPIVIMLVLILAMQIAATSIAIEKEAKTLETLLTVPVSRLSILFGKLAGSVSVALLATVANVLAFTYYIGAVLGTAGIGAGDLGEAAAKLAPAPEGYLILGLSIFGALISALAIALTLGTLAQDVRGAQSIIGVAILPVFLPAVFLMIGDISTLPSAFQAALYLIPFTYPALASQALFTGDYGMSLFGLAYMALFTLGMLYIAARIFSTERIMTARITLKARRME
ncbi:MAG: ABC transporter permease [Candidatus Verstraetearchaeota archaeon]|nr:ABC transporter permease [Candidatus Verstraetearchaeota archaeon]